LAKFTSQAQTRELNQTRSFNKRDFMAEFLALVNAIRSALANLPARVQDVAIVEVENIIRGDLGMPNVIISPHTPIGQAHQAVRDWLMSAATSETEAQVALGELRGALPRIERAIEHWAGHDIDLGATLPQSPPVGPQGPNADVPTA